ncbi:hypothetical protein SNE40_003876 [Patella caerulea]|uniref:Rieske domain-containing protein n=1 Tax=Patella caerulea TaxID=87958 RepID=A0AAN8KF60_PATCE
MTEIEACSVDDIQDGGMKDVEVEDGKILLVQRGQEYFAVGGKCTHYGAPLVNGSMSNGVVRCPWHGACFNVQTGDIEDFPGLDSLPTFDVSVKNGKIYIHVPTSGVGKRLKNMCGSVPENRKTFVLVGGGPASVVCAETLRQEGFTGRIIIVSKESVLPYDRPKLSKAMDAKPESLALRNAEFYKKYDIEIRQGHEVVSVDTKAKLVRMYDGKKMSYDSLFIATGGKPRVLPIPGSGLKNVCSLRTPADANFIAEQAKGKDVVVVGSSFIGLEVTAFLHDKCKSVTVIGTGSAPLQRVFGEKLGRVFQKMHEEKGVKFYFEKGVKALRSKEDDILTEVVLSDGTVISADICILGVGVVPATDFLKKSDIELTKRGFVSVNERLQTNIPDVYAGGDIVEFPLFTVPGSNVNIQHWQMAHQHGKIAGYNMNGISREIKSVPYFWTVMYGKSVRYTGYGPGYDDVIVHGDLDVPKFAAFYTKGDNVVAVASLAFDPIVSQAANLMLQGEVIQKSEIISDPKTWVGRLKP